MTTISNELAIQVSTVCLQKYMLPVNAILYCSYTILYSSCIYIVRFEIETERGHNKLTTNICISIENDKLYIITHIYTYPNNCI